MGSNELDWLLVLEMLEWGLSWIGRWLRRRALAKICVGARSSEVQVSGIQRMPPLPVTC
jgi:hypothetical protein